MRYVPDSSVVADRTFSISTGLAASTVTPGSTLPDESFTTPVIEAWATANAGQSTEQATGTSAARTLRIHTTPLRRCFRSCRRSPPPAVCNPPTAVRYELELAYR